MFSFIKISKVFLLGLGLSTSYVRALSTVSGISNKACFGAGCYWGTEKFFKTDFDQKLKRGFIKNGAVGFMGPPTAKKNPTYREVCTGTTQQVEVYNFEFDGTEQTYENLVKHFFMFHDPTTLNRQGNDAGTQYASVIFYYDDKQKEIASKVKDELQILLDSKTLNCYQGKTVTTALLPSTIFYPAQDDHQAYLDKNPWGYCNHAYRFKEWPNTVTNNYEIIHIEQDFSLNNLDIERFLRGM